MHQLLSNISDSNIVFLSCMEYNIHHTTVSLINHDMLYNFYLHYSNIPTQLRYLEFENIVTTTVPLIEIILYILLIIFLLIAITNSSLINPGPVSHTTGLNILYQNVQGLVPFTELNKTTLVWTILKFQKFKLLFTIKNRT